MAGQWKQAPFPAGILKRATLRHPWAPCCVECGYAVIETVKQPRTLTSGRVASLMLLIAVPSASFACSAVACINSGPEFRRDFLVVIKHDGKPLRGATVEITSNAEGKLATRFSGVTASNGVVRVDGLLPGEYWLNAELMGVNAAYHCFHVAQRASRTAEQRVKYEWGDFALATRQVAGRLIDSQPGTGETPLWNQIHRRNLPISESRLKLQDPLSGRVFLSTSGGDGAFAFHAIPDGLYVLHIEGGRSNRDFEGADKLIRVSAKAKGSRLTLTKRDAGGGDCGGTVLELGLR